MFFLCIVYLPKKFFFCFTFALNHVLAKIKSRKQSHHICLYASLMKDIRKISEYKLDRSIKNEKYIRKNKKEKNNNIKDTKRVKKKTWNVNSKSFLILSANTEIYILQADCFFF